nr:bacteriocin immunity protein [uncultured Enterobacter sp.]
MPEKKNSDVTEKKRVSWVNKIIATDLSTDKENDEAAHLTEHPSRRNLIFRP